MPSKADYAKIAIACNKLGIDRKQLISDRYNLESAKDLSTKQLRDLFSHLRSQGFAATSSNDFIVVPNSTLHHF